MSLIVFSYLRTPPSLLLNGSSSKANPRLLKRGACFAELCYLCRCFNHPTKNFMQTIHRAWSSKRMYILDRLKSLLSFDSHIQGAVIHVWPIRREKRYPPILVRHAKWALTYFSVNHDWDPFKWVTMPSSHTLTFYMVLSSLPRVWGHILSYYGDVPRNF